MGCGNEALTDKETLTSAASAETLCCWGSTLEPHEIRGRGCDHNPGPPFAIGDIILCNVGDHGLQHIFVRLADDPWYQPYLTLKVTVGTSLGESWLAPHLDQSPGNLKDIAKDQDSPWESVRSKVILSKGTVKQKMGSYRVHRDAQRESLLLVEVAKLFAKAVKADDAEVPEYLWNDQVRLGGARIAPEIGLPSFPEGIGQGLRQVPCRHLR